MAYDWYKLPAGFVRWAPTRPESSLRVFIAMLAIARGRSSFTVSQEEIARFAGLKIRATCSGLADLRKSGWIYSRRRPRDDGEAGYYPSVYSMRHGIGHAPRRKSIVLEHCPSCGGMTGLCDTK